MRVILKTGDFGLNLYSELIQRKNNNGIEHLFVPSSNYLSCYIYNHSTVSCNVIVTIDGQTDKLVHIRAGHSVWYYGIRKVTASSLIVVKFYLELEDIIYPLISDFDQSLHVVNFHLIRTNTSDLADFDFDFGS
jgi:hypothetical protein